MTTSPRALLPAALEAIAIASGLVRSRMPGPLTAKGDRDMATELDYAVERAGAYFGDRRLHASTTKTLHDAIVAIGDYAVGENAEARNPRAQAPRRG